MRCENSECEICLKDVGKWDLRIPNKKLPIITRVSNSK